MPVPKNSEAMNGGLMVVRSVKQTLTMKIMVQRHPDPSPPRCQIYLYAHHVDGVKWNNMNERSLPSMYPSASVQKTVRYLTEKGVLLACRTDDGDSQAKFELEIPEQEALLLFQ